MLIRDPIHGNVEVADEEGAVLAHPAVQRLRHIGQLGFAAMVYPGATHSRFGHSLGTMFVAGRMLDRVLDVARRRGPAPGAAAAGRMRRAVRLAGLLHDVGHAPFSHALESRMPPAAALAAGPGGPDAGGPPPRAGSARHEDFTLALLTRTDLADAVAASGDGTLTAADVASVLVGRPVPGAGGFEEAGTDWLPLLHQIVSSELDADRMDYLLRDSLHAGVSYGRYDLDWLAVNLIPRRAEGVAGGPAPVHMALENRAVLAFENFLLCRFHMHLAVYLHHRNHAYDHMLDVALAADGFTLPAALDAYLDLNDHRLWDRLARLDHDFARAIVRHRPFERVVELSGDGRSAPGDRAALDELGAALSARGIPWFVGEREGRLSSGHGATPGGRSIPFTVETALGDHLPIERATPLFERYGRPIRLVRLFVAPGRRADAQSIAEGVFAGRPLVAYGEVPP